jgi:hypothetical protein
LTDPDELGALMATAVVKSIAVICLTVFFSMSVSQCSLDKTTIESCEKSCKSSGSQMKSVTFIKCTCEEKASIETTPWVLSRVPSKMKK